MKSAKKKPDYAVMTLEELMKLNDYVMKNLVIPWPEVFYIDPKLLRQKFPKIRRKDRGKIAFTQLKPAPYSLRS